MGTVELEALRSAAMALSERERAKLASDLVASLDGAAEVDVMEAWDVELCHRIGEIDAGKADLVDANEVISRIRARIRS